MIPNHNLAHNQLGVVEDKRTCRSWFISLSNSDKIVYWA